MRLERARRAAVAASVVALLSATAIACGDSESDDAADGADAPSTGAGTTEAAPAEPEAGGRLAYATSSEPRGFDPLLAPGGSINGDAPYMAAVFDQLAWEDPTSGEVVMRIAESITSTDAMTWTVKLRPDVKFSDGTPFDTAAVKFQWERYADPNSGAILSATVAALIGSMTVVDPLTLSVTLKSPNGQFPRFVAQSIPHVASPTAYEAMGADAFAKAPVGAGPFLLEEWIPGTSATFTRNPEYWDAPRPYLDTLVIHLSTDNQQSYNALVTDTYQVWNTFAAYAQLVQARETGQFQEWEHPTLVGNARCAWFNLSREPFNNPIARQAIAHALDYEKMDQTVNLGAGSVPKYPIREPSPFHDPDATLPQYEPEKAQQLLDQYAAETGQPLSFTWIYATSAAAYVEFFVSQLKQYDNLEVRLEEFPNAQAAPIATAGDFELMTFSFGGADPEPAFYQTLRTDQSRNYSRYSNPTVDAALDEGRATLDVEVRKKAYDTAQEQIVNDAPALWFSDAPFTFLFKEDVRGFTTSSISPMWAEIWLSTGA